MRFIHIVHPTRSRPERSVETINKFVRKSDHPGEVMVTVCLDDSDPRLKDYWRLYRSDCSVHWGIVQLNNKSSVEAINNGFKNSNLAMAPEQIIMVISDDTDCTVGWDTELYDELDGKTDFILKTKDGIQDYIITNPILDLAYYNRFGYIYHPDFQHLFCDTYMTCVADITGRKITSNLLFKHNHYSVGGAVKDDVNKKNDATWKQGEETFIRLMKQFTPEERNRISDQGMKNWLRNHGVR